MGNGTNTGGVNEPPKLNRERGMLEPFVHNEALKDSGVKHARAKEPCNV